MNHIAGSDEFFVVLHCDNNEAQKIENSSQTEAFKNFMIFFAKLYHLGKLRV